MSIFSGIKTVSITGNRPENIREGEYLFSVAAAKGFVSRKDVDSIVFEFRVEEAVQTGDSAPNRVGSKVRAYFPLYRNRGGDLTEDGARWMGRFKTLVANILGGDERVDSNGVSSPVTDEEVTGLIAASIVKGTEHKVSALTDDKKAACMMAVATASTRDGGLALTEDEAKALIDEGSLNFADVTGMPLRCAAKVSVSQTSGKAFTNLYWAPAV